MNYSTPAEIYGELFITMHESGIWSDGKSISDALPKVDPEKILTAFETEKKLTDFDLKEFAERFFTFQEAGNTGFKTDSTKSAEEHIKGLWNVLTRAADKKIEGSSLLPLPYPYIVPGGRFNEIYYWDSYFTMLGLKVSGRIDLIESMIDNFAHLIETVGFIPNGNCTYFMGRSQPPFFAAMVNLLAEQKGKSILEKYLPFLEKESNFWMSGKENLNAKNKVKKRVVQLEGGILNRYWDNFDDARAEMYSDDLELQKRTGREATQLNKDLRAACESGWDFSSRWLHQSNDLGTIHASEIIPVDLNCLLWNLETTLADAYNFLNKKTRSTEFSAKAATRKTLIQKYLWNESSQYFHDFDFVKNESKTVVSAAGIYPLFFKIATKDQAAACAEKLKSQLLQPGGVVCTPHHSGQQWDAPNGWAPLQWIAIQGLKNYGFDELANDIKTRWLTLNETVFKRTGKMLEKYNVENIDLKTGGGEYPVQDGFGWTNGVYLALLHS